MTSPLRLLRSTIASARLDRYRSLLLLSLAGQGVVLLALGALLASTRSRAVERMFILAMASLLTLLVGLSRIALGVHWAIDVLAGWAFGAAWAMVWLLLARRFARDPSAVEPEAGRARSQR